MKFERPLRQCLANANLRLITPQKDHRLKTLPFEIDLYKKEHQFINSLFDIELQKKVISSKTG